jgi:hypothetical protein
VSAAGSSLPHGKTSAAITARARPGCCLAGTCQLTRVPARGKSGHGLSPGKRDQLHRAGELVIDGVSAARFTSSIVGRGPSPGVDRATAGCVARTTPGGTFPNQAPACWRSLESALTAINNCPETANPITECDCIRSYGRS